MFSFSLNESISPMHSYLCFHFFKNKYLHTLFSLTNPLAIVCLSSLSLVLSLNVISWFALVCCCCCCCCWWLYIGKYGFDCLLFVIWWELDVFAFALLSSKRLSFSWMAALCGISVILNEGSCKFECCDWCCCCCCWSLNLFDVAVVSRTSK